MATIPNRKATVDTDITNKVAVSSISPQNVGGNIKAVFDELRDRGITVVEEVGDLATINSNDFIQVIVKNVGIFKDAATGPANGTSVFAGVGGRFWVLQDNLGKIDVFLVAGQSNMVGQGTAASSPNPSPGTVYQYYLGAFGEVTDEVGAANTGSAWPTFGIMYHNLTGRKICFVPSAVNGTSQTAAADVGNGNWSTSGTLYQTSVDNTNDALAAIIAAGYDPELMGILWGQGESDARAINLATITAVNYTNDMTTMVANYRTEFGANLPFYIFQTGNEPAQDGAGTGYLQIRNAQQAFADANPLLNIMAFRNAITFVSRGLLSDGLHYNQTGLNEMGLYGAVNVVSGVSRSLQAVGTTGLNFPGFIGIKPGTPAFPIDIENTGIAKMLSAIGNINDSVRVDLTNLSTGGFAGSGVRLSNSLGLRAHIVLLSSASSLQPDSFWIFCTNHMLLGSDTGFVNIYAGGTATPNNAKLRISPTGEVGIGHNATADITAQLDVTSTTKGFRPPRMTKAQRDAIVSPAIALTVYQTDNTPGLRVWNGTNWMRYTETAD